MGPRAIILPTLLSLLGACAGALNDPIVTEVHRRSTSDRARVLVVLLPGAGDRVGTYEKHGFVQSMRASGMDVDMLEVDAHYGYYRSRTLMDRMEHDVLAPNREHYEAIWLVGISMGGIGALLTAWTFPDDVDGLVLMAPYLGRRKTLKQIEQAGGLAAWEPPAAVDGEKAWDVEIWRMLKRMSETPRPGEPELYLMFGRDDFGVRAHELLAAGLAPEQVKTAPGGHAWSTWTTLWNQLLAERPIDG
ncbi:serine aminopeptidase domain-containing protein [Enhygromyxa salina]|uniref:Alpha/beta hydrolase family protein n=1 Tax=Enhygromyxa salina TaxID=215803 RepID=A0A2S9YJM4_9BACT|nr:alpha/beta hydrolase [Enhygromyxa salina]PRQ05236.1 Alpha/beta hydrolase family protein [Enhygromyxa salina]